EPARPHLHRTLRLHEQNNASPTQRTPTAVVPGHASPETTYAYLEYTDDLIHDFEEAFRNWLGDGEATYAQIAAHALGVGANGGGTP
ncbi:hypothetical protein ACFWJ1_35680, partial [Streptomyces cinereoruber]